MGKGAKVALAVVVGSGVIFTTVMLVRKKKAIKLLTGINTIVYTGPTRSLPEAMTNIQDKVAIIWWDFGGQRLFYDFLTPSNSTLSQLKTDNIYTIAVTEDSLWIYA